MPTLIDIDSFVAGVFNQNTGTFLYNYDDTITAGGSPAFDRTVKRTLRHHGSAKVVYNAASQTYAGRDVNPSSPVAVVSFYFRAESAPSADRGMAEILCGTTGIASPHLRANGKIGMAYHDGTGFVEGPDVCDGQWHLLDMMMDTSTSTRTIDWQVDGVPQSQSVSTYTPENITWVSRFGGEHFIGLGTIWYSDYVVSVTEEDYPIGPHSVLSLIPDADGTHNLGGVISKEGGATTNLFQAVDDLESTISDTATYIQQTGTGTGNYAEVGFTNPPGAVIWDVGVVFGEYGSTTPTNTVDFRLLDASNNQLYASGLHDCSILALRHRWDLLARPGGGWTPALLSGTKLRWGFSDNVAAQPRLSAAALEYAVGTLTQSFAVVVGT